jgi:hypothetical protein
MTHSAKRAKQIYEVFCKLNTRNIIKKRGRVICRETDTYYTPEKAVDNFFNAILKAEEETALERVILVALRELTSREVSALKLRLKEHCLQEDLIEA